MAGTSVAQDLTERAEAELALRQRQVDRLRILADAAREFSAATPDRDRLLDTVARRLCEVVGDYCVVFLASPDNRELAVAALHAPDAGAERRMRQIFTEPMLLVEHPIPRQVHDTGEPLLVTVVDLEALRAMTSALYFEFARDIGIHSLLLVALRAHGRSIGQLVLVRYRASSPSFDRDDVDLVCGLADHASLAISNARALDSERAAQDRYRMMFDVSPQPMFVFDTATLRFLEANDAAQAQYGYTQPELLTRTLVDIWPAADVERNRELAAQSQPATRSNSSRHCKRDGSIRDVELRSHALVIGGRDARLVLVNDVTDRLRAEHARTAAELRFACLRDSGIIGIFVVELNGGVAGRVLEVNDALLDIIGYRREELLSDGFRWSELTPPEWRPSDTRAAADLARHGTVALREKQLIRRDGSRVPVLISAAMIASVEQQAICFVLDLRTTKQLDATIELLRVALASEATFRGFLEAAPEAVIVMNAGREIALVNTQAEHLFGYGRAELIGRSIDTLLPDPLDALGGARAGPGIVRHGRHRTGSKFPIEITSRPLDTAAGVVVYASIRDLSERMRIDAQRFGLAAIVESSADAIIGKTLAGIVTSWNAAALGMFGFAAEEMIGRSVAVLALPGHDGDEPAILERLTRGERVASFDTTRVRKDGSEIEVSVTISPIRDAEGTLVGASKVVRDITARRRAERELGRAKAAADASNRELEAFSYSIAHDLRAPLRAISGFARLLVDSYRDRLDAEGDDWLQEIVSGVRTMGLLIDAMLSLARLTRSELRHEQVDISILVRAAAKQLAAAEPDRVVELVVEDDLVVEIDPELARAVINNLLGNAWKFTSHVTNARIEIGANHEHGVRTLFIRDNGAGFDMAYAPKLFGAFERLHATSEFPGTGIGLATVQRIIQRHGGRVSATGVVNGGATFYFSLPVHTSGVAK